MKLYRAFATVGGMTMISRVLGFVRDILIAGVLGTGWVADAFFVAFRFPNLFRRLFGEGAFNSAFVPLFAKELEGEGRDAARQFAADSASVLTTALLIFSALAMLAMPWLMYLLAPGFSDNPEKYDLAVVLTQICFPYLACISLVALFSGVLNALGKFAVAAATPILLNVVLIAVMAGVTWFGLGNTRQAGIVLAWGVFAGGLAQLAMVAVSVWRNGMGFTLSRPRLSPRVRRLVKLGVPGVIAGGITQVNIVVGTIIASLQAGAVSYLYYADRIYQLPLGLVGVAIGVVLLPDISRQLRAGNDAAVADSQNRSLEFALLLTLPAAVALAVVPYPIIQVLFERGAFGPDDTAATAAALTAFAFGLPAFVLIKVFSPAYFAREDTRTPMYYAGVSMVVNVVGSLALFYIFQQAGIHPHIGIAIATSVAGWANAGLLWMTLVRRQQFQSDQRLRNVLPLILLASLAMGAVLWLTLCVLGDVFGPGGNSYLQILALAGLVGAGGLVYAIALQLTGAASLSQIKRGLKRR